MDSPTNVLVRAVHEPPWAIYYNAWAQVCWAPGGKIGFKHTFSKVFHDDDDDGYAGIGPFCLIANSE